VVKSNETFFNCRIKGKLRLKNIKSTNPLAVGDHVTFDIDYKKNNTIGNIIEIKERKNYIVRRSVKLSKQVQIIASNIDQLFLLVTLNNPITSHSFIDRILVTAEAYHIKVVLLFNKIDCYNSIEVEEIDFTKKMYESIGYKCYKISAINSFSVQKIIKLMRNKVSVFSGHSGVGKSSLVNTISPNLSLRTAKISDSHKQGQHTTTYSEMFDLDNEIKIIDTPGIKGFGIVDMVDKEIGNYFPEFINKIDKCKFKNCMHVNEPSCEIINALERKEIAKSRYKSYLDLLKEDTNYRN